MKRSARIRPMSWKATGISLSGRWTKIAPSLACSKVHSPRNSFRGKGFFTPTPFREQAPRVPVFLCKHITRFNDLLYLFFLEHCVERNADDGLMNLFGKRVRLVIPLLIRRLFMRWYRIMNHCSDTLTKKMLLEAISFFCTHDKEVLDVRLIICGM